MHTNDWILVIILLAGMYLSIRFQKLNLSGALTGGLLAGLIYLGSGIAGVAIMATFFMLGTLATGHKMVVKESIKAAEKSKGRRNAVQVLCNAGIPAFCALLAWAYPQNAYLFRLMMAAGFSSATADTLSSEMGTVYGKKFYNIVTLKPDRRGMDGVVSLEGILIGILGSLVIALLFYFNYGKYYSLIWIVISGVVGNLADSYLGATLQRRNYLNNNSVNLLNTLSSVLTAVLLVSFE